MNLAYAQRYFVYPYWVSGDKYGVDFVGIFLSSTIVTSTLNRDHVTKFTLIVQKYFSTLAVHYLFITTNLIFTFYKNIYIYIYIYTVV
jgi:hypothetical protein